MKKKYTYLIILLLIVASCAAFGRIAGNDFINYDDPAYITDNGIIPSGITPDGIRWAFSTKYFGLWNPLVWLSLMFDYQLYGLNAGGYHVTNLILHILSALLLFWLFHRMTGAVWKSAFVAALFALHPLHVESVAWVAERKDVLSAFFWMLTLCLYVYYTEKPTVKRYLLVVFGFVLALMSKPMVVTLPVIMILLDYWPLNRFKSQKGNFFLWQLKEKLPLFVLSAVLVIITLYTPNAPSLPDTPDLKQYPLLSQLANSPVAFVTYIEKTFWPHDMAVFYPFSEQSAIWRVIGASLLIILITTAIIVMVRRLPYLFVGWFWYTITIAPVIGIIQISIATPYAMADRYHYLPSIGIAIMLAWGIPLLFKTDISRRKILFPVTISFLIIMSVLTWIQCGYWKNSVTLFNHALKVTKNNYMAHNNLGLALAKEGKDNAAIYHYSKAIVIVPGDALPYQNRGIVYAKLGQYQQAINDYNEAIRLKPNDVDIYEKIGTVYAKFGLYQNAFENFNKALNIRPDYANIYNSRGIVYDSINQHQLAFEDFNKAVLLRPDYADAYYNRGTLYHNLGRYQPAIDDLSEAIRLKPDNLLAYFNRGGAYINLGQYQPAIEDLNKVISLDPASHDAYNNRGFIYLKLGRYQQALEDYSKAIMLKPDYADAYNNRAFVYLSTQNMESGCHDAQKACELGNCATLQAAQGKKLCR